MHGSPPVRYQQQLTDSRVTQPRPDVRSQGRKSRHDRPMIFFFLAPTSELDNLQPNRSLLFYITIDNQTFFENEMEVSEPKEIIEY